MSLRLGSILFVTALVTLALQGSTPFTGPVVLATPASFTLVGRIVNPAGWGFTSTTVATPGPDLTVTAGEMVTMSLLAGDAIGHNWGVDYDNNQVPDPGEPVSPTFGSSTTPTSYTFTATTTPGTYTYYCFIHHGPMIGNFIVQDFSISANPSSVGPLDVGAQGTSTITISQLSGFSGTVDLSTSASAGLTASVNPTSIGGGSGTSTLTVSASVAGFYTVNVTGTSGTLSHQVTVTVNVAQPDFSINASPTSVGPINVDVQGTSTITISPVRGFTGTVDLTTSPSAGLTASVNPTFISGGSGASTLTVSASTAGSYTVNVTGTSGPLSHRVTVTVDVVMPDFSISASPTTIGPLNLGSQGTSTITIGSLNGFSGNVDLTTSPSAGLTANVNPTPVPGGSGSSTLTVSAATAGSYTVTVTGTSGSLSHFVVVTVSVVAPDFSLSAAPTLSVSQGSSGSFTVSLQSLGGFSGNVGLTVTITPAGPAVSPSSGTVGLAQGGGGSFAVTVSVAGGLYSTVSAGVYTVRVTGVSGSVSHSVDVAVTVTGGSGIGNLPWAYAIGAVVAVAGAAAIAVFLVRRGRAKK